VLDSFRHGKHELCTQQINIAKNSQTLFLISSSVWLLFGEGIFGIPFELVGVNVSSVPNEVLEELVAVLLLHDDASGLDDIFDILNKLATFGTELVLVDRGMVEDVFQRVVDLSVVG
jgi:hypothetical protein